MSGERVEFGGSATYRIVAQGILPAHWRGRVGGMEIIDTTEGDDQPQVTLVGPILDQAALRGVLETLYHLHMSIISIERLKDQGEPKRAS
jgi:hypothetical protein